MNDTQFHIVYDGVALASNEMDVKDLAPSLLAVGELFEEANRILNGNSVSVSVKLRATEKGSVDVVLMATQTIMEQAKNLFNSDAVNATLNVTQILEILGIVGGGKGLLMLLKKLKSRNIHSIELEHGAYKITLEDGEIHMAEKKELELFKSVKVRKSIETIITRPLRRSGVSTVSFRDENKNEIKITEEQAEYFTAPEAEETLIDETEIEQTLQIVSVTFQEGGKWRFSDGNASFFADIMDATFLEKVSENRAAFAKDDLLKVKMKRRQSIAASGGIKTEYSVLKVMEHKSAAITYQLPFTQ